MQANFWFGSGCASLADACQSQRDRPKIQQQKLIDGDDHAERSCQTGLRLDEGQRVDRKIAQPVLRSDFDADDVRHLQQDLTLKNAR